MIEIFLGGLALLYTAKSFQNESRKAKSRVYSAFRKAYKMTRKHIEETRQGEFGDTNFSDVDSDELANAWADAAEAVRPYNPSLAQTFDDKSDYWRGTWGFQREIQEGTRRFNFKFRLDEVEKELHKMEEKGV